MSKLLNTVIGVGLMYAGFVAFGATVAAGEAPVCCNDGLGCPGTKFCCDPEKMGANPCNSKSGNPGYCLDSCPKGA